MLACYVLLKWTLNVNIQIVLHSIQFLDQWIVGFIMKSLYQIHLTWWNIFSFYWLLMGLSIKSSAWKHWFQSKNWKKCHILKRIYSIFSVYVLKLCNPVAPNGVRPGRQQSYLDFAKKNVTQLKAFSPIYLSGILGIFEFLQFEISSLIFFLVWTGKKFQFEISSLTFILNL